VHTEAELDGGWEPARFARNGVEARRRIRYDGRYGIAPMVP